MAIPRRHIPYRRSKKNPNRIRIEVLLLYRTSIPKLLYRPRHFKAYTKAALRREAAPNRMPIIRFNPPLEGFGIVLLAASAPADKCNRCRQGSPHPSQPKCPSKTPLYNLTSYILLQRWPAACSPRGVGSQPEPLTAGTAARSEHF